MTRRSKASPKRPDIRRLALAGAGLLALLAGLAPHSDGRAWAQGGLGSWTLTALTAEGAGRVREPDLAAAQPLAAFQHNGDPSGGNPDRNPEIFVWRQGGGLGQVTRTGPGGFLDQSRPTLSGDGLRIAFLSDADLAGANADGTKEVFLLDTLGPAPSFLQITDAPSGDAAEGAALSRDGKVIAFWHDADLTGANPDGSIELYRAEIGGRLDQLTDLRGAPYHSRPEISADGSRVAFVLQDDLTGGNADDSWELFAWSGPPTQPGDRARFLQLTDWRPPLTARELYDPTVSDDGQRIAFAAGRGQVDVGSPGPHQAIEIYLWEAGLGLSRLSTATSSQASSILPRISGDGRRVAFLSRSDFGGGNANGNLELFVWHDGGVIEQVTDTFGRPGVSSIVPELLPGFDGPGHRAAYVAEQSGDPAPLGLSSREGLLVLAEDGSGLTPTPVAPSPTRTPLPTPTSASNPTPEPLGRVCPQLPAQVPPAVIAAALAAPQQVEGWLKPANPALPPSWRNPLRTWLSLRDSGKPFGPFNGVVWKAGCP
ncbi:MAG: PD40 domain-containing protein [Caldilineae bacterium]|nr:PD40 domain-containing protein [Caldilineae bacterium]